jgi:hypothetical protein
MFIGLSIPQSYPSSEAAADSKALSASFLASASEESDLERLEGLESNKSRTKFFNLFPGAD